MIDVNQPIHTLYEGTCTLYSCTIEDSFGVNQADDIMPLRSNKDACLNDAYDAYVNIWKRLRFENHFRMGSRGQYIDASGYPMLPKEHFCRDIAEEGVYIHMLHKRIIFKVRPFKLKMDKTFFKSVKPAK